MTDYAEIYKACLTLADAKPSQLDIIHKQLWDKSNSCRPHNKKYYVLASDIAALARDRRKKK